MAKAKQAKPAKTNEETKAEPKVDSAVIAGQASAPAPTPAPTPAPCQPAKTDSVEDLDSILLAADSEEKVSESASASTVPQMDVDADTLKKYLEAVKARKDAEAAEERYGEMLMKVAAPKRIEESRKKGAYLSSIRMIAEGVTGNALYIQNRYTAVKPDAKRDAKKLIEEYKALLGTDMQRFICVKRGFEASAELCNNLELMKKLLEVLAAAGLAKHFQRTYEFMPSDEFHRNATLNPAVEKQMQTLVDAKLAKPKKASMKAS